MTKTRIKDASAEERKGTAHRDKQVRIESEMLPGSLGRTAQVMLGDNPTPALSVYNYTHFLYTPQPHVISTGAKTQAEGVASIWSAAGQTTSTFSF